MKCERISASSSKIQVIDASSFSDWRTELLSFSSDVLGFPEKQNWETKNPQRRNEVVQTRRDTPSFPNVKHEVKS